MSRHDWTAYIQVRWIDRVGRLYENRWARPRPLAIDGHAYRRRTRRRRATP